MINTMFLWLRSHSSAILASALVVSKAGLLGKAGTAIVTALAIASGVAI
jgi:hypothetical protein